MKTVFVVDDNDTNLLIAETLLGNIYNVITVPSAAKMFKLLEKYSPDIILLDIEMPEINGFQALQILKSSVSWSKIPVIFVTGHNDPKIEALGLEMGAVDFISKPLSAPVLKNRMKIHLDVDTIISERTSQLNKLQNSVISVLADMVENRNKGTKGHSERTSRFIKLLLDGMKSSKVYTDEIHGWDEDKIIFSARMHDLGKISINDKIVNKPGKLSDEEFEIMKTHARKGEEIIDIIIEQTGDAEILQNAKLFAGHHHERWDGKGYPRGLKETEIPLHGRLMAIVDGYDALVSDKPYKKAFTHNEAVQTIMNNSGTSYDPKIVEVFENVKDKFEETANYAA